MLGDGAIHGRPVAGQVIVRCQPSSRPPAAPLPQLPAARLEADDLAERQAVAHRHAEGADERCVAGLAEIAFDHLAAERVRAVEDPDLAAGSARRLGRPDRGRGEGVVARADVLQVDEQQVEARRTPRGAAAASAASSP